MWVLVLGLQFQQKEVAIFLELTYLQTRQVGNMAFLFEHVYTYVNYILDTYSDDDQDDDDDECEYGCKDNQSHKAYSCISSGCILYA